MSSLATAARHSMDSADWYTSTKYVEAARAVMGGIDLDPASHEEANQTIKATHFYDQEANGLAHQWLGRIFINPPGGKDAAGMGLVPAFWLKLLAEWMAGRVEQAIWIGYSLEQLQTLQSCDGCRHPLDFAICIPARRIAFIENEAKRLARIAKLEAENVARAARGEKLKRISQKADGPSHANYIAYLGHDPGKFGLIFRGFGQVRL